MMTVCQKNDSIFSLLENGIFLSISTCCLQHTMGSAITTLEAFDQIEFAVAIKRMDSHELRRRIYKAIRDNENGSIGRAYMLEERNFVHNPARVIAPSTFQSIMG